MDKKKDIQQMVDNVFSDKSEEYKSELIELLSPEHKISMLQDLVGTMEKTEKLSVPLAFDAIKTKGQRRQGGKNSHEMSEIDRAERNRQIQELINHLCLKKKHSYKSAQEITAKRFDLHPRTIKKISKNPLS